MQEAYTQLSFLQLRLCDADCQHLARGWASRPLQLHYAITIHKGQGQTLEKAVIDIGKAELAGGCTFVAVSRLKPLNDGLFQPMSFQRLQAISTGKRLGERLEETRLKFFAS